MCNMLFVDLPLCHHWFTQQVGISIFHTENEILVMVSN